MTYRTYDAYQAGRRSRVTDVLTAPPPRFYYLLITAYCLLFTSVFRRLTRAHVVTFHVHNLDQISKRIPGEETRPER